MDNRFDYDGCRHGSSTRLYGKCGQRRDRIRQQQLTLPYTLDENKKATILSYSGTESNIIINRIDGKYAIVGIAEGAFAGNENLVSVELLRFGKDHRQRGLLRLHQPHNRHAASKFHIGDNRAWALSPAAPSSPASSFRPR